MKHILFIVCLLSATFSAQSQTPTACTQNYQLACDEEKRISDEVKRLQCRLDEVRKDKQTLIACIAANQNKAELDRLKTVLISTLNEVNRIQSQPLILPIPCTTGNCN